MDNKIGYAGIADAGRLSSIDVKTNAIRLRRFQYVFRRLVLVAAGQLPARAEWEVKMALARHMHEDAEAASCLLERVLELRVTESQAAKAPDALLGLFLDEVLRAQTDPEYLLGIYEVVRPALLDAIARHVRDTQPLVDYPTVRVARLVRIELEDQIGLGRALIAQFVGPEERRQSAEYVERLRAMLAHVGGFDGTGESRPQEVRRWRSIEPHVLPLKSARPADFGPSVHIRLPGCLDEKLSDAENALREMMKIRQEEMTAAELIAGVMYETTEIPWSFHRTLARHCWDEARHAAFGQAALESHGIDWRRCPQYTAEYEKFRSEAPAKAYAFLSLGIETSAMAKNGKQHELHLVRDVFKDPLMAVFQDYDWADELQHAGFGRTWGAAFFDQDFEQSRLFGEEAWMELLRYRATLETDREKYHSMFYLEKFGQLAATKATGLALAIPDGG
jgi:hypothetical protein